MPGDPGAQPPQRTFGAPRLRLRPVLLHTPPIRRRRALRVSQRLPHPPLQQPARRTRQERGGRALYYLKRRLRLSGAQIQLRQGRHRCRQARLLPQQGLPAGDRLRPEERRLQRLGQAEGGGGLRRLGRQGKAVGPEGGEGAGLLPVIVAQAHRRLIADCGWRMADGRSERVEEGLLFGGRGVR